MNKATFDRAYKAQKGHMLDPIVVRSPFNILYDIKSIEWDAELNAFVISLSDETITYKNE